MPDTLHPGVPSPWLIVHSRRLSPQFLPRRMRLPTGAPGSRRCDSAPVAPTPTWSVPGCVFSWTRVPRRRWPRDEASPCEPALDPEDGDDGALPSGIGRCLWT